MVQKANPRAFPELQRVALPASWADRAAGDRPVALALVPKTDKAATAGRSSPAAQPPLRGVGIQARAQQLYYLTHSEREIP